MGMTTHVMGFRPPNDKWKKMKTIWDLCLEEKIKVPEEVAEFFDHDHPDEVGVEVTLVGNGVANDSVKEWCRDGERGFQVDISLLPKGLNFIRFYNSY